MKASLTNSLPLLHQRSKILPPHHLPKATLFKLVFSTLQIGQKTLIQLGIRGWRLMIKCNQPPRMFLRLKLILLTHCLRDIYGGGTVLISVMWQHRIIMSLPSKMAGSPQSLSYIEILLHCLPFKWFIIALLPSTSRAMKEADIAPLTLGYLLRYLGLWILISTCYGWKREAFWSVTYFDQEANTCPYRLG